MFLILQIMLFLRAAGIEVHTSLCGHYDVAAWCREHQLQLEEEVLLCLDRMRRTNCRCMRAMTDTAAFTRVLRNYLFSSD